MTLTVPKEFWPILQENRDLLHGMPTMAAEAIQLWAKDRYRVRILVVVVQQTFGGFLNFHPHLHIMVSAGGLQESKNRWIHRLAYNEEELMRAWRYAVIAFLAEALKKKVLKPTLFGKDLMDMFKVQHKREWHVFITHAMSKAIFCSMQADTFGAHRSPGIASTLLMIERSNIWQRTQETTGSRRCGFPLKGFCIS
jgi:hypothetical protein